MSGNQGKAGQNRNSFFYNKEKGGGSSDDPYETPLNKRRAATVNPMISTGDNQLEHSSQALCFDKNLSKNKIIDEEDNDMEEIKLEQPARDNLTNFKSGKKPENHMLNYTGYDLDPKLLLLP